MDPGDRAMLETMQQWFSQPTEGKTAPDFQKALNVKMRPVLKQARKLNCLEAIRCETERDKIAAGLVEKLFWLRVAGEVALLFSGGGQGNAARAEQVAGKGHHVFIPKRWLPFLSKRIGEKSARRAVRSSANVMYKGSTKWQRYLWHWRVDPLARGFKGWAPTKLGLTTADKYGLIGRLWYGSPHWLQKTVQGLGAATAPEVPDVVAPIDLSVVEQRCEEQAKKDSWPEDLRWLIE